MNQPASPYPISAFQQLFVRESTHWWFIQRNALLLWVITQHIGTFRTFLEIGCGTGFVLSAIRDAYPAATLTGTEYYAEGLAFAQQRLPQVHLAQLDAQTMQDEAAYDVVGAFDVLEHIPDDQLVLHNIARALTPRGYVMITVPQHRWLWSYADTYAMHERRYTIDDLRQKVHNAGLDVVYTTSFVALLLPLMLLARRRVTAATYNPDAEFDISPRLNAVLMWVMHIELTLIRWGVRFPVGGSRFLLARKRT